ncbi:MAG: hypothetical protein KC912_04825 [Proteobacteria bacterium]|nr:hypothetical protein [Pseudomonadota bacterium]
MRRPDLPLVLALCLGACTDDAEPTDSVPVDTADSADVCDRLSIVGQLTIPEDVEAPAGPVAVDVIAVQMSAEGLPSTGVRAIHNLGTVGPEGAAYSLCIEDTPVEADLYAPDVDDSRFVAATYVLRAFVDDGNGDAEQWLGASLPHVLLFASNEPPATWASLGVVEGWNLLTMDLEEGLTNSAVPFASGDALDLEADLLVTKRPPLTGTFIPDLSDASSLMVGAYHITNWVDTTVPPPPLGTHNAFPFTVQSGDASFAFPQSFGRPPESHLSTPDSLPYLASGLYMVMAWEDLNGGGTFEVGEGILADSTSATQARGLAYVEAIDWRAAFYGQMGLKMGWNLSEGDAFIDWSSGVVLDTTNVANR